MSQSALINLANVRVMCVDDDPVIRSVIRFALQRHGCKDVVQANGGMEALDLCAGRTFDLMICDFLMAPMTGLELLRELAGSGLADGCPMIMLSAETNPETVEEARTLGVRAWISKPVSVQTLIEEVAKVLRGSGLVGDLPPGPEVKAAADRHQARLMAALRVAEEATQNLNRRPREAAILAQNIHQVLNDAGEHARALGYGLLTMLAGRATEVASAMARNPGAASRGSAAIARALGTLVTAMKRVAQNRMEGDGGEAGLKLLAMIDGLVAPVLSGLDRSAPDV
jgi:two-component system, chemotaxis family, chemotaxis protein CheY